MSSQKTAGLDNWRWIDPSVVLGIDDRQLAEPWSADGICDRRVIESALSRSKHLAYGCVQPPRSPNSRSLRYESPGTIV